MGLCTGQPTRISEFAVRHPGAETRLSFSLACTWQTSSFPPLISIVYFRNAGSCRLNAGARRLLPMSEDSTSGWEGHSCVPGMLGVDHGWTCKFSSTLWVRAGARANCSQGPQSHGQLSSPCFLHPPSLPRAWTCPVGSLGLGMHTEQEVSSLGGPGPTM